MSVRRYDTTEPGLLKNKKKKKEEECKITIFLYFMWCIRKLQYYSDVVHSFDRKSAVEHNGGV